MDLPHHGYRASKCPDDSPVMHLLPFLKSFTNCPVIVATSYFLPGAGVTHSCHLTGDVSSKHPSLSDSNTTDSYTSDSADLTSMSRITSDLQNCAVVIVHVEIWALYVQTNTLGGGGLLVLVPEDTEVLQDSLCFGSVSGYRLKMGPTRRLHEAPVWRIRIKTTDMPNALPQQCTWEGWDIPKRRKSLSTVVWCNAI